MRSIAAWLTARLIHSVAAIVGLFLIGPPLSGGVVVLVVLKNGIQRAVIAAAASAAFLTVLSPLLNLAPMETAIFATVALGCAIGIGVLVVRTGSVTLTAQLALVLAIAGIVLVSLLGPDPETLWKPLLANIRGNMEASGLQVDFDAAVALVAPFVPGFVAGIAWLGAMLAMYLGYGAYALLPGEGFRFGQFRELNLGRVLAALTVAVSLLATLAGSSWAANVAFVMILAFILQGLALCHWFVASRGLPPFVLLIIYLALILTLQNGLVMISLSVMGYVDAWFDMRRRLSVNTR